MGKNFIVSKNGNSNPMAVESSRTADRSCALFSPCARKGECKQASKGTGAAVERSALSSYRAEEEEEEEDKDSSMHTVTITNERTKEEHQPDAHIYI